MSSAYWRYNQINNVKKNFYKKLFPTIRNLRISPKVFTQNGINLNENKENKIVVGRSYYKKCLRLKSNEDLKTLYYILLRRKIAYESDIYFMLQNKIKSIYVKQALEKIKKSITSLISIFEERENIKNNTMILFEFFYYKKQQYKEIFYCKYPLYKNIKEPFYSKSELAKIQNMSEKIDNIFLVNDIKVKNIENLDVDLNKFSSQFPINFELDDYYFVLKQIFNNNQVKLKKKELAIIKKQYKRLYEKEILEKKSNINLELNNINTNLNNNCKIIDNNNETKLYNKFNESKLFYFESSNDAKLQYYENCKLYLDLCKSIADITINKIKSDLNRNYSFINNDNKFDKDFLNNYSSICNKKLNLLEKNKNFVFNKLNSESYYIEVLNNKEQDFINVDLKKSFLIDEFIAKTVMSKHLENYKELNKIKALEQSKIDSSTKTIVVNQLELTAIENLKQKTSFENLMPQFVNKTYDLDDKSKRKLIYSIQKGRSKIAKEIFIKEMAALSYKVKNSNLNKLITSKIIDNNYH